jgi:hypothetical protein
MKNLFYKTVYILILAFLFAGCRNLVDGPDGNELPDETGTVRISIEGVPLPSPSVSISQRTLMPTTNFYIIKFFRAGLSAVQKTLDTRSFTSAIAVDLSSGTWTVDITAYTEAQSLVLIENLDPDDAIL